MHNINVIPTVINNSAEDKIEYRFELCKSRVLSLDYTPEEMSVLVRGRNSTNPIDIIAELLIIIKKLEGESNGSNKISE